MANRPSRLVVPAYTPSYDGRYHLRYPHGDKPITGAELAGAASSSATAAAAITAMIRMAAQAQGRAAASGGLSTAIRLAAIAAVRASASGSLTGAPLYPWDSLSPHEWALGSKTDPGAGTQSNPLNPTQAMQVGSAASGDRKVQWIGGSDWNITAVNSSGGKYAAVIPTSGASSTRRVIHQAEYPGDTDPARRVRIRRTGGAGSILGFHNTNNAIWDGFVLDTKTGAPEPGAFDDAYGEYAQLSAWFSNGCKFIRCHTDHQGAIYVGGNRSNLYIQYCDDVEVGDCRFTNIGDSAGVGGNVLLVEVYDCTNFEFHHNELWNAPFGLWDKGLYNKPDGVHTHRIHHNLIHDVGLGIGVSNPIQTTLARAVWAYQNLIWNCMCGISVSSFNSDEPKGIAICNNTMWRMRRRNGVGEFYGFQGYGLHFRNETPSSFASDCLIVTRNNALYDVQQAIYTHDTSAQYNNLVWDRNSYDTYPTAFWRQGEGGPAATIDSWRGQVPQRDLNSLTGAQGFVNIANDDARPGSGSILLNAGTDYLNLLGGGTSAPINIGAYITADLSDVFGPRI